MNTDYYWFIELYSGEIIKVKPEPININRIQKMLSSQQGAITTPTRSIIVKDIKDFRISEERYTDQKLLEETAQAFDEPVLNPDGSVICRWVKKSVPRRRWDTYYRFQSSCKLLYDGESFVVIAFFIPVHQINHQFVQELTPDEERQLSVKV